MNRHPNFSTLKTVSWPPRHEKLLLLPLFPRYRDHRTVEFPGERDLDGPPRLEEKRSVRSGVERAGPAPTYTTPQALRPSTGREGSKPVESQSTKAGGEGFRRVDGTMNEGKERVGEDVSDRRRRTVMGRRRGVPVTRSTARGGLH